VGVIGNRTRATCIFETKKLSQLIVPVNTTSKFPSLCIRLRTLP